MNKEQAFKLYLPKWPQCIISGKQITEEQALEIIRRTDDFFTGHDGGNNHLFVNKARELCGVPDIYASTDYADALSKREEFFRRWNSLSALNYLTNSWVSSNYIGGPHGWCHPDGTIQYDYNIGKWPEVKEVFDDLTLIAKEFSFLDMTCTLMDGERDDDASSVVSFIVKDGKVEITDPISVDQLEIDNSEKYTVEWFAKRIGNPYSENYFSLDQIRKWVKQVENHLS